MSRVTVILDVLESSDPDRVKEIETTFHPNTKKWILDKIDHHKGRYNWSSLPSNFEHDEVKVVHKAIRDHFPKKAVTLKVHANRATTFDGLRDAVMKVGVRPEHEHMEARYFHRIPKVAKGPSDTKLDFVPNTPTQKRRRRAYMDPLINKNGQYLRVDEPRK
jgi:hypothetical protein